MSSSLSQQVYEMLIKFPGKEKESIILPPWIAAAVATWGTIVGRGRRKEEAEAIERGGEVKK